MDQICPHVALMPRLPGFLLSPLGWASEPIAAMAQAEPRFLAHLFEMSRTRMHLLALALAHLDSSPPRQFAEFLARESLGNILRQVLGDQPIGIKRALAHLPDRVLSAKGYQRLVQLLSDQDGSRALHHIHKIDDSKIAVLCEIPPPLRRIAVIALDGWLQGLARLADGLHFLVSRNAAPSFDALVTDLGRLKQSNQFIARIKQLVEALPLPDQLPPCKIGKARRLDQPAEILALAKRWRNCLAIHAGLINDGGCAIYLWEDAQTPAACLVERQGRFGWFIEDVKGPRNAEIEPNALGLIGAAFAQVGIQQATLVQSLKNIIEAESKSSPRRCAHTERIRGIVQADPRAFDFDD
jgi:hypothetical protein